MAMMNAFAAEAIVHPRGNAPTAADAAKDSAWISLKHLGGIAFVIETGVITGASTITVEQADNTDGDNNETMAFDSYVLNTDGSLGAKTAREATGFATGTTNNVRFLIVPGQPSDGKTAIQCKASSANNALAIHPVGVHPRFAPHVA